MFQCALQEGLFWNGPGNQTGRSDSENNTRHWVQAELEIERAEECHQISATPLPPKPTYPTTPTAPTHPVVLFLSSSRSPSLLLSLSKETACSAGTLCDVVTKAPAHILSPLPLLHSWARVFWSLIAALHPHCSALCVGRDVIRACTAAETRCAHLGELRSRCFLTALELRPELKPNPDRRQLNGGHNATPPPLRLYLYHTSTAGH